MSLPADTGANYEIFIIIQVLSTVLAAAAAFAAYRTARLMEKQISLQFRPILEFILLDFDGKLVPFVKNKGTQPAYNVRLNCGYVLDVDSNEMSADKYSKDISANKRVLFAKLDLAPGEDYEGSFSKEFFGESLSQGQAVVASFELTYLSEAHGEYTTSPKNYEIYNHNGKLISREISVLPDDVLTKNTLSYKYRKKSD